MKQTLVFTIKEKVIEAIHTHYSPGKILTRREIIDTVCKKYPDTNRTSIIPSDYCDNISNKDPQSGLVHIFHYLKHNTYEVLKRP